jgi:hypothetical protein
MGRLEGDRFGSDTTAGIDTCTERPCEGFYRGEGVADDGQEPTEGCDGECQMVRAWRAVRGEAQRHQAGLVHAPAPGDRNDASRDRGKSDPQDHDEDGLHRRRRAAPRG